MNLEDAIENYVLACIAQRKAKSTLRAYSDILKMFQEFVGDVPVSELEVVDIRRFMAHQATKDGRMGKPISGHSLHKYYSMLRTFIRWLYRQGWIEVCLTDYTSAPKLPKELPEPLDDEELRRLVSYLETEASFRDKVIFEIFLDTGLRRQELTDLTIDDVNLNQGWIMVRGGKGEKDGIVPIGRRLRRSIHTYMKLHRDPKDGVEALFISKFGGGLTSSGVDMVVRRVMRKLKIKGKIGAHKLRHTFATQYLRNDGNLESLRKILRHEDIKTTQRYVHLVTDDMLKDHDRASPLDNM